ncbi:MAG: hypothetical protein ABFS22_13345, partial [Pseudomonadota bacterium]
HKLLLVVLALALAISPVHGVPTLPMIDAADDTSHCARMQHDMQTANAPANAQLQEDGTGHQCEQGCNGGCCSGACSICAHGAFAMSDIVIVTLEFNDTTRTGLFLASFPERTVIPPLRPPAFLHS